MEKNTLCPNYYSHNTLHFLKIWRWGIFIVDIRVITRSWIFFLYVQEKQHNFCHSDCFFFPFLCLNFEFCLVFTRMVPLWESAVTIAWSNASFKSRCVSADVSTYVVALMWRAKHRARISGTGVWPYRASSWSCLASRRLSLWVPTRISGASGQKRRISGSHFSDMFWNDVGLITLKHRRNTSESG